MQQWSQQYFTGITDAQHDANNIWFHNMRTYLKDTGRLYVPYLDKWFNKQGEEIQ